MLVNEEVCENVFIISSSTDYEFSAAIHFQGFDVVFTINRLMTYGFRSWQIKLIDIWPLEQKNYLWKLWLRIWFMKLWFMIAYLFLIFFDPSSKMTKRNIKSNQGVTILYRLNYDKLW